MQGHPPGKETERDLQCARGIWAKMTELGCKISKTGTDVETVNRGMLFIWEGGTRHSKAHTRGRPAEYRGAAQPVAAEPVVSCARPAPWQEVSPEHPTRRGRMEGNGVRPS